VKHNYKITVLPFLGLAQQFKTMHALFPSRICSPVRFLTITRPTDPKEAQPLRNRPDVLENSYYFFFFFFFSVLSRESLRIRDSQSHSLNVLAENLIVVQTAVRTIRRLSTGEP
jgi:hypothetical protein